MHTNGWTKEETRELFNLAAIAAKKGEGLKRVFEAMAEKTDRKPNSVRNYYYAQAKTFSLVPEMSERLGIKSFAAPKKADFVAFEKKDVDQLISTILIEQAKGRSVRAITTQLAHGDPKIMLRLQNKYRSMVFSRRGYIDKLMATLSEKKLTYFNPIAKNIVVEGKSPAIPVRNLFDSMQVLTAKLGDTEIQNLFSGLSRLVELAGNAAQRADENVARGDLFHAEIERLRAENNALKQKMRTKPTAAQSDTQSEKLRQINKFFLEKADKDKIRSLGDYISELGEILTESK